MLIRANLFPLVYYFHFLSLCRLLAFGLLSLLLLLRLNIMQQRKVAGDSSIQGWRCKGTRAYSATVRVWVGIAVSVAGVLRSSIVVGGGVRSQYC
jgi:hypothetical protein